MTFNVQGKKPARAIIPAYMEKKVVNNNLGIKKTQEAANQQLENSQNFREQRSDIARHTVTHVTSGNVCTNITTQS